MQKDAALELGVTERHVRRLLKALKKRGDQAGRTIESQRGAGGETESGGSAIAAGLCGIRAGSGDGSFEAARDLGQRFDGGNHAGVAPIFDTTS